MDAAFIWDLPIFVCKMLDKHNENEIWMKLGGDHVKDTLRWLFIFNLKRPNSKFNTYVIAMANVPDKTNNIQRIMDDLNLYRTSCAKNGTLARNYLIILK